MPSPEAKRRRAKERRMRNKQERIDRLAAADVTGWTKLSSHHFRRIVDGMQVDWWPSTGKWCYGGIVAPNFLHTNENLEQFLKGRI